jgi:hypothetical protein
MLRGVFVESCAANGSEGSVSETVDPDFSISSSFAPSPACSQASSDDAAGFAFAFAT